MVVVILKVTPSRGTFLSAELRLLIMRQPVLAFSKIRLLATPCLILMVLGVGSLTYTDPVELTPALLREFVSKLVVNAPDKSSGHRVQRIDVHYNFIREIDLSPEFSKYSKKTTA